MKKMIGLPYILLTIFIPFMLIMASVRILLNPFFLDYEYTLNKFPPDAYGFSTADRLNWGKVSLNYLTNAEGIEYLGDIKFDDGTDFYNSRELSHMLDVKNLVQITLKIWYGMILFSLLLFFTSWRFKTLPKFWKAVSHGGWLTIGLILVILAGVVIDFDALFRGFHAIFFTGDTWLFYTTDSLIRLFPEKLWSDAFTFMGIFTLVGSVLCAFVGARLAQPGKDEPAV